MISHKPDHTSAFQRAFHLRGRLRRRQLLLAKQGRIAESARYAGLVRRIERILPARTGLWKEGPGRA